jgi:cytochrome P450
MVGVFSDRIKTALKIGLDSLLDIKKGEERVVNTWDTFTVLISYISCPCFAGSNVGYDKDLIVSMATFTQKVLRAGIVMTTLPEWLGNFVVRHFLSVEREMDVVMNLLVPEIEKIRDGQADENREVTFSEMALSLPKADGSQRSTKDTAYYFHGVALASIHTTSQFTTFALHELSCRPSLVQDLRTELASLGENRTPESVAQLPLMDSFFREVLRQNMDHMGLHHLTLRDTTLSTGHVIPKGTVVVCAIDQIHRDERFLPIDQNTGKVCLGDSPLDQFDAYRFYGKNIKSTTVGLEYLPFGLGAHACPGRFFASNEIKYVLGEMLLRFNVKTKFGERAKDNVILGMTRFPPLEPLIFEGL